MVKTLVERPFSTEQLETLREVSNIRASIGASMLIFDRLGGVRVHYRDGASKYYSPIWIDMQLTERHRT